LRHGLHVCPLSRTQGKTCIKNRFDCFGFRVLDILSNLLLRLL
jgi:hypothetical protein